VGDLSLVNAATVTRWLESSAVALHEQRDYLTQLDAAIGDADHGTNMDRGFATVVAKLEEGDGSTPPGKLLVSAGSTLVSTVGGASGPLWGTALRRAGRSIGDGESFDAAALALALEAALDGVVELGAAQPGDKTMVDALQPAVRVLRERVDGGASTEEAVAVAPGVGCAPLLRPLQRRPHPGASVSVIPFTLWPSVRTGPSKRVSVFPSILTSIWVGAACAIGPALMRQTEATKSVAMDLLMP